jgi:sigma-B regulation protein RsbU (phosphoserine phosphatase)
MALGIDPSYGYAENIRDGLRSGQIIVIGTDGIWETQNESGEMFGKQRFKQLIQAHHRSSAEAISRAVVDGIDNFRSDAKQTDDITLVVVKIIDSTGTGSNQDSGPQVR